VDPVQQILSLLRGYDDRNRRDILEAVAIHLGYSCTLVPEHDEDEEGGDDDDDNIAPWGS